MSDGTSAPGLTAFLESVYSPPSFSGKAQDRNVHGKSCYFELNLLAGAFAHARPRSHPWTQAGGAFCHYPGHFSRLADRTGSGEPASAVGPAHRAGKIAGPGA